MSDAGGKQNESGSLDLRFRRKVSLCATMGNRPEVGKKHLINRLNYLNFKDDSILITLVHGKYGSSISLKAKPLPCLDGNLQCVWSDTPGLEQKLRTYRYVNFIVPDLHQPLLVEADLVDVTLETISFRLPETCREISSRRINRHHCRDIKVRFLQNGAQFDGDLVDFSPASFRVDIECVPPQSFHWVNQKSIVHIVFFRNEEILYSGDCEIIKQDSGQRARSFVMRPVHSRICRFQPKEFRSSRHRLLPSPDVIFTDPLTGKTVNLKVVDISGSGLSVEETEENSVLLPGRVIPELNIDLAGILTIRCRAQVVYRNILSGNAGKISVRCGLAILDMDINEHVRLLALLHQATDQNSYICNKVDMEALWELFFQTGFLYPEKYSFIQANKVKFKETYEKLYSSNPHIARHFVYQRDGRLCAHIAMVRFYENTWLIHHHAADKHSGRRAGLSVLEQIGRSINDSHGLYSTRMNYVACYFRPENRFPQRVFGGIAEQINDKNGCSMDAFAYFHYRKGTVDQWDLSGPWSLQKTQAEDLAELESFYRYTSGGLLLHALDLDPGMLDRDDIGREYESIDFRKEKHLFSLKRNGSLKALFVVNVSDIGLNLSDLTNCIHTIIIDDEDFPRGTLYMIYSLLSKYYDNEYIPVLVYPVSFADKKQIVYDKIYNLWILSMQYTDGYFRSIDKMLHNHHE